MKNLRLPPFRHIHTAYVTSDVESGKRKLTAMFGIADFKVYQQVGIEVPGGSAMIDFALAHSNGTALEVIQPVGGKDDVYRRALPANSADIAFHHFATRIADQAEWDMVVDAADHQGLDAPVRGDAGEVKYIYLDTRAQLGHMLEFIWPTTREAAAALGLT